MTQNGQQAVTGDASTARTIDPAVVAERADVEFAEQTYTHENEDHCEADADGRVIVGVTGADGEEVLLLVNREQSHAILPHCTVDADETWTEVAQQTAKRVAGAPVTVGDPIRVRRVEHYTEDDDEPHNVTHQIVFEGSLATDRESVEPSIDDDTSWTAGWYRSLPVDIEEEGDALRDLRAFLE